MTIQNIDDVMERIMSLNRNLTEESLKTLLSASGWDKEDITEGLHIFRSADRNQINTQPINSINTKSSLVEEPINVKEKSQINNVINNNPEKEDVLVKEIPKDDHIENNYTFNIRHTEPEISSVTKQEVITPEQKEIKQEVKVNSITDSNSNVNQTKKKGSGKVIFLILLLIILLIAGFYFYNIFLKKFYTNNTYLNNQVSNNNPIVDQAPIVSSSSSNQIDDIKKEIENLKQEISNSKISTTTTKTIIKYISQRGPIGKAGRGIVSITSTSTGFIINYTDNTSSILPYSSMTNFDKIGANYICLNDLSNSTTTYTLATTSSSGNSSNICLDKSTFLNLVK